jgi:hypothetical protein
MNSVVSTSRGLFGSEDWYAKLAKCFHCDKLDLMDTLTLGKFKAT